MCIILIACRYTTWFTTYIFFTSSTRELFIVSGSREVKRGRDMPYIFFLREPLGIAIEFGLSYIVAE